MAELSADAVREEWGRFMSDLSRSREPLGVSKPGLRAAFDAINTWVEVNQGSFNTAIPLPARTALAPRDKARILLYIIRRRFEVS